MNYVTSFITNIMKNVGGINEKYNKKIMAIVMTLILINTIGFNVLATESNKDLYSVDENEDEICEYSEKEIEEIDRNDKKTKMKSTRMT